MSRKLLKRVLDELDIDRDTYGTLCKEIEVELNKPEPEPVAWMVENHPANDTFLNFTPNFNSHFEKLCCKVTPLYTTPPDQSARIAELAADGVRLMETITELRSQLVTPNWENNRIAMQVGEIKELKQQLATLQAKREPLTTSEIDACYNVARKSKEYDSVYKFARAIEEAHGITNE